jgi:hypothetical protein
MNTWAGEIKILSSRPFVRILIILGLTSACGASPKQIEDVPIAVSGSETQTPDTDLVIANAQKEVEKILPGANLTFFSLVAECQALSELQGEVHLHFRQTRLTFSGVRVFAARVVVDTIQQKLRMTVQDETQQYLTTELLELKGLSAAEIASNLETYLDSVGKCDGTVVLARASTNYPWSVRCGPPNEVFINCINIEPETGDITVLR